MSFDHAGRKYSNADAYRTAKRTIPADKKPLQPMSMSQGEPDGDEQDGAAIAQQHGPANEVHIEHAEEMGSHHVHSVHPDGHEHHSDHASKEEAHEHGKKLAGVGAEMQEPEEGSEEEFK